MSIKQSIPKIKGRFYPLQHNEWLQACKELLPAERDVLYYIRTLDPYNNSVEINTAQIARDLSTDTKTVHRQTVSRALKKLDEKGFIDLELVRVKVVVAAKGMWCEETPKVCGDTQEDPYTPSEIPTHPRESVDTKQPPEALPAGDSTPSKILLDLLNTLSEAERENFERFIKESWRATTGKEVGSIRAFLSDPEYQCEWLEKWQASPAGKKSADEKAAVEWEKDPRFDEWLNKCYFVGRLWTMEDSPDKSERVAFFKWAQTTNAYLGRIDGAS